MARVKDKDLWRYHKIDTQFNDHYLNSAFNKVLDHIENGSSSEEIVMADLMNACVSSVKEIRDAKEEIKKLNKYIAYLQEQNKELINK